MDEILLPIDLSSDYGYHPRSHKGLKRSSFAKKVSEVINRLFYRKKKSSPSKQKNNTMFLTPDDIDSFYQQNLRLQDAIKENTFRISTQFKSFFSALHRDVEAGLPHDVLAPSSSWNPPESWAVMYLNSPSKMKSYCSRLLNMENHAQGVGDLYDSSPKIVSSSVISLPLSADDINNPARIPYSYSTDKNPKNMELPSPSAHDHPLMWWVRIWRPIQRTSLPSKSQSTSLSSSLSSTEFLYFNSNCPIEFITLSCNLEITTSELLLLASSKFSPNSRSLNQNQLPISETTKSASRHELYVIHKGMARLLHWNDKPLLLQKKWFEQLGYNGSITLSNLGLYDHSYMCQFIFFEANDSINYLCWLSSQMLGSSIFKSDSEITPYCAHLPARNLLVLPVKLFQLISTLESLDLSRNPMVTLPLDFIQNCQRLSRIALNSCELDIIPRSIPFCNTLTHLSLSDNLLKEDALDSLCLLKNLEYLDLTANHLSYLPLSMISLTKLKGLNLSSNGITTLPSVLFHLKSMEYLDFSFNFITAIQEEISSLENLRTLILAYNRIKTIEVQVALLPKLEKIDVRGNCISDISVLFFSKTLSCIYAQYNYISKVHFSSSSSAPLTSLNLDNNSLSSIDIFNYLSHNRNLLPRSESASGLSTQESPTFKFGGKTELKSLSCKKEKCFNSCANEFNGSKNLTSASLSNLDYAKKCICHLPGAAVALSVSSFQFLTELLVCSSKLVSLPDALFVNCPNLVKIWLDNNQLREIPASIENLSHTLASFSIANNRLTSLPSAIGSLKNLEFLDLHGNNLVALIPSLFSCPNLMFLNCSSNLLSLLPTIPSTNFTPSPLQVFNLSDNQLTDESIGFFITFPKLRILNLSYNSFNEINLIFNYLFDLRALLLSGNEIVSITEHIENCSYLEYLFLNGNRILSLPAEISKLQNLALLDVSDNQLRYNINNWPYDWHWQWNTELLYLNLSGNSRFEVMATTSQFTDEHQKSYLVNKRRTFSTSAIGDPKKNNTDPSLLLSSPESEIKGLFSPLIKLQHLDLSLLRKIPDVLPPRSHLFQIKTLFTDNFEINDTSSQQLSSGSTQFSPFYSPPEKPSTPKNIAKERKRLLLNLSDPILRVDSGATACSLWTPMSQSENSPTSSPNRSSSFSSFSSTMYGWSSCPPLSVDVSGSDLASYSNCSIHDFVDSKLYRDISRNSFSSYEHFYSERNFGFPSCSALPRRSTLLTYLSEFVNFSFLKEKGGFVNTLLGLFDGHHEGEAPYFLSKNFSDAYASELKVLLKRSRMSFDDLPSSTEFLFSPEEISCCEALKSTFLNLNRDLSVLKFPYGSGCSGVVVHISQKRLFVANVGDCMAVLCRSGYALVLSRIHSGFNKSERAKVSNAGGFISFADHGLVNGIVPLTRSFGYWELAPSITADPSIHIVHMTPFDEFIILANSELWAWIDPQIAVDIASSTQGNLKLAAAKLRDIAIGHGSKGAMNIQIISLRLSQSVPSVVMKSDLSGSVIASPLRRRTLRFEGTDPRSSCDLKGTGHSSNSTSTTSLVMDSSLARLKTEISPPMGSVAIVFTDIQSSTLLWELIPAAMEAAIKIHNSILRRLLRTIGGYEAKTDGDAFMVTFPDPISALKWCLYGQVQLLHADWPQKLLECPECIPVYTEGNQNNNNKAENSTLLKTTDINGQENRHHDEQPQQDGIKNHASSKTIPRRPIYRGLSVRMGIHSGNPICELDPITQRMDYFGVVVNRAARISGIANGGQICLSNEVYEACINQLTSDDTLQAALLFPKFTSLGSVRLKGVETSEVIYSVYPESLLERKILSKNRSELNVTPEQLKTIHDISRRLDAIVSFLGSEGP